MNEIRCTAPHGTPKILTLADSWIPEWRVVEEANGGRRPPLAELANFAICGQHGHLLRKEGVYVYRLAETLKRERARREELASQGKQWQVLVTRRFVPKTNGDTNAWRGSRDAGRNLGGGLSRYVRTDAEKQKDAAPEEPKSK